MPGPAVPTPDQVNTYLAAHSLESIIEEAVNDAVLKQVKVCAARICTATTTAKAGIIFLSRRHDKTARAEPMPAHCRNPHEKE